MATRVQRDWQGRLVNFLDSATKRAFTRTELAHAIDKNRPDLRIPATLSISRIISFLSTEAKLREIDFVPEVASSYAPLRRYAWGEPSPYACGLSLRANAYLSHASAVFIHGLTNQVPKTIYVNREQSPKPASRSGLTQDSIDRAFKNNPRTSQYIFSRSGYRYVLLSGKNTGQLEVTEIDWENGEVLRVTKLERTLIDLAVRPAYGGGVFEVLKAYRAAREKLSVRTLVATLKKLKHAYPYHQAIGYYMERAGYEPSQLRQLRELGFKHDFYLAHRIQHPEYNKDWHLFYPQGFENVSSLP